MMARLGMGDGVRRRLADRRLERTLRDWRTEASAELTDSIERSIRSDRSGRTSWRHAPAVVLAAALVAALVANGAAGYTANAVGRALAIVDHAATPATPGAPIAVQAITAGADQYTPAFTWGDPNATHPGPPVHSLVGRVVLSRAPGGTETIVRIVTLLDEQADCEISVLAADGRRLTLIPRGTLLGAERGKGSAAKVVRHRVLVPGRIVHILRLPTRQLALARPIRVQFLGRDPSGATLVKTVRIPL